VNDFNREDTSVVIAIYLSPLTTTHKLKSTAYPSHSQLPALYFLSVLIRHRTNSPQRTSCAPFSSATSQRLRAHLQSPLSFRFSSPAPAPASPFDRSCHRHDWDHDGKAKAFSHSHRARARPRC